MEEEFAIVPGVLIRLSQVRGLRWKFNHTIGKYLYAGYVEVRDILVSLTDLLDLGEFRRWVLRQHSRKCRYLRGQFPVVGQQLISPQHIGLSQRIEPRRNPQAIVTLQSRAAGRQKPVIARL